MRTSVGRLIKEVHDKNGRLMTLYIFHRQDETPLKMTTCDLEGLYALANEKIAHLTGKLPENTVNDAGVAKILQTEFHVCALTKVDSHYSLYSWSPPVPLQSLGRGTGECYFQAGVAQQLSLAVDDHAKSFERRADFYCSDREGAQAKARRGLVQTQKAMNPNSSATVTNCDVHIKCSNRESACASQSDVISKIKQAVLSMNFANHRRLFRTAVQKVLLSLDWDDTAPPIGSREINVKAMELLLPPDKENEEMRAALIQHFPGHWGCGRLVWYKLPDESVAESVERMIGPATAALIRKGPGAFPSNKWTNSEQAPRWLALLENIGIFSHAYMEFMVLVGDEIPMGFALHAPEMPALADAEHLEPLEDVPDDGAEDAVDAHHADAVPVEADAEAPVQDEPQQAADPQQEKQIEQHKFRRGTFKWIRGGTVFADCFSLSVFMYPHVRSMRTSLWIAGEAFDRAQRMSPSERKKAGNERY